jgi:hypothetical protein
MDCTGENAQKIGCVTIAAWNAEHGITANAKKSAYPGIPVKLPNGATVPDRYAPGGQLMAPTADLSDVATAGKKIKKRFEALLRDDPSGITAFTYLATALKETLHQNGDYDYQRASFVSGQLQQLPQFRDVSNFNVGLLGQQAGLSLNELLTIAGTYARFNSSNYRADQPFGLDPQTRDLTILGFNSGASGLYGQ